MMLTLEEQKQLWHELAEIIIKSEQEKIEKWLEENGIKWLEENGFVEE